MKKFKFAVAVIGAGMFFAAAILRALAAGAWAWVALIDIAVAVFLTVLAWYTATDKI